MEGEEEEEVDKHHGCKRRQRGLLIILKASETKDLGKSRDEASFYILPVITTKL